MRAATPVLLFVLVVPSSAKTVPVKYVPDAVIVLVASVITDGVRTATCVAIV